MNAHYLLTTELARRLYEEAARDLPLVDYHNHLSAADLSSDRPFEDLAELWLLSDPYKHRVMRICGVDETLITGPASHYEKFKAWCEVYPRLMGGPLYDWSRTEMAEVFGITHPICADNARRIWQEANEKLRQSEFIARGIFKQFKVEYAAPCAAITEDLRPFLCLESLAPSLRADDLLKPDKTLLDTLGSLTGLAIVDQESLTRVLRIRLDEFHAANCRFSDHALDEGFRYVQEDGNTGKRIRALAGGETLPAEDQEALCSAMLRLLGAEYAKRGWTMQLHIGAQRFTSSRLRTLAGPAGGFAGIGGGVDVRLLVALLDDLERGSAGLPKTILYTLNPADNAVMAVLCGSFIGVTQGPAWWWCDHLQGMREMLEVFSSFSVLSTFIGMTTDSRSLLSLLRHDYFRRALCGWLGEKAVRGELPEDFSALSGLVRAVCYENAKKRIAI